MIKKVSFVVLFFLFTFSSLVADAVMAERYLTAANNQYLDKNYKKSYEYVNIALKMYEEEPIADNTIMLAEMVYYGYLSEIKTQKDMIAFAEVKEQLNIFPLVVSDRITVLIKTLNAIELQSIAQNNNSQQNKEIIELQLTEMRTRQETELKTLQENQMLALETQKELLTQLNEQTGKFTHAITESVKQAENNNHVVLRAVALIGVILIFVFIIIIIAISISFGNNKRQQEQFAATLKMVAQMNKGGDRLALGGVTDIQNMRSAGSSRWGVDALPEPEQTEEEKQELSELAYKCERLGSEIDFITGRKNNSKNVSEMVFKLACAMGIPNTTAMVYFCASMVYDAGFLSLDQDLLQADELTETQKNQIKCHVRKGIDQMDFVPAKYHQIFVDAATKHHENLDGTGYPDNLKGDDVPEIARLIRISESFVSLISRRKYRGIMDKESAIAELRLQKDAIDQKIVDVLDSIV